MVEDSIRFSSISSAENRDSIGGDEEIYEKIEAPKFVDFTSPEHYHPDDRYWFCLRVGCDHKHEEEMDSEAIYNKFVLRVMAARSPNVRLKKALERNASKTPIRCPLSAPPKPSKPKLSSLAIPSLITVDEKKRVLKTPVKPKPIPLGKTKPVAAKYLSTPRNKRCPQEQTSFRSVQNQKVSNNEVPRSRTIAKALFVHSPEQTVEANTYVAELRTTVSQLCEGMKKLEFSTPAKRAMGYTSKACKNSSGDPSTRQFNSSKVQTKLKEPLPSQLSSPKVVKSKAKKLPQQDSACNEQDMPGNDRGGCLKKNEPHDSAQQTNIQDEEELVVNAYADEQASTPSMVDGDGIKESDGNESGGGFVDHLNQNKNSSDEQSDGIQIMDGDNKENAAAPDANRIMNTDLSQNGRKIFGILDKSGQAEKHVQAMKIKRQKTTNPKPFSLRTDERGILKEASLERKATANPGECELAIKLPTMQGKKIQKANPKPFTSAASESSKLGDLKLGSSPLGSNAMQRLEKFRKIKSPLQRHSIRSHRLTTPKKDFSYLIPGQKLDTIHEASPEVSEINQLGKLTGILSRPPVGDGPLQWLANQTSTRRMYQGVALKTQIGIFAKNARKKLRSNSSKAIPKTASTMVTC